MLFALAALIRLTVASPDLYTLMFRDSFQGSSLDTSVWNYRTDAKNLSQQLAANVQVGDGLVSIDLKQQQEGSYAYGGGIVSKAAYHYGYYEARIKMNSGAGWHTAFWLQAGDTTYPAAQVPHNHTEIDIVERNSIFNHLMDTGFVEWNGNSGSYHYPPNETIKHDFTDWNRFGAEWQEDSILVYVNGNQIANMSYTAQTWTHDYLNIWFTCIAFPYGSQPDNSALPSAVQASEISYYQKDFYLTSGSLCFLDAPTSAGTTCPSNAGYSETGSWSTSSHSGYTAQLLTRYSCDAGATATWALPKAPAGTYEIWTWQIPDNADTAASYAIKKDDCTVKTVVVNQAASRGWVKLSSGVKITKEDWSVEVIGSGNGCVRADTVKFVRIS